MCHVRERMISINKFKDIVEVKKRVMIFSLKVNAQSSFMNVLNYGALQLVSELLDNIQLTMI